MLQCPTSALEDQALLYVRSFALNQPSKNVLADGIFTLTVNYWPFTSQVGFPKDPQAGKGTQGNSTFITLNFTSLSLTSSLTR